MKTKSEQLLAAQTPKGRAAATLRTKYRRFRAWQESPFRYALNEDEAHHCNNCGHEYVGNFCPRCGQKATLGEVNWSGVRENVMEIWGVGTRSMTYTLWQLVWRPGHLIRDYISGKRQVSFPPVKMLLIVAIICTLIINQLVDPAEPESVERTKALDALFTWLKQNRGWGTLAIYSLQILPTWVLFHHSPRCTAHTLPQGFFIQVFLSTLIVVFSTFGSLFSPIYYLSPLYYVIAYYQLFGYSLWGTLWRVVLSFISMTCLALMIVAILNGDATIKYAMLFMIAAALAIVLLAIGYAIGWWTQKRRIEKQRIQI